MNKTRYLAVVVVCLLGMVGCGYSTRTISPLMTGKQTIYVAPFVNRVDYAQEARMNNLYVPMIETRITNDVAQRFLSYGRLKIARENEADLVLKGELLGYQRDTLRYDLDDNIEEYRVRVIVSFVLWDTREDRALLSENRFSGDATFFLSGSRATSEDVAVDEAIKDLARRLVDRVIEDW